MASAVTQNILDGLARIAPQHRAAFERNRQQFLAKVDDAMGRWNAMLAPYKGSPVVVNHALWIYFLTRFGLVQVGTVEERPGIPATANHIVKLVNLMKEDRVKAIIAEPWSDLKLVERIAQEAGARAAILAATVGSVKGTDTFIDAVDFNVKTLAQMLK
jgi:zinc/manganese transport system substrate-binding protein